MVKVEISRAENSITLKIPKVETDKLILTNPELPTIKVQANICEFSQKQNFFSKTIPLDEQEVDLYSSAIEFVNYLPKEKALIVNFWNSSCYLFYNVPDLMYAFLLIADSKGKVFHQLIQKKYKSKQIPDHFTVADVKEILEEESQEEDISLDMQEVFSSIKNPEVLSNYFKSSKSTQEKVQIIQNQYFPIAEHFQEIMEDFWLSYTAIKFNRLNEQQKNALKLKEHQYISSPRCEKATISIIVPQYLALSNHINSLKTIPEVVKEDYNPEKSLKKGQALMKMDSKGNLELIKYKLDF
jgi:hypothetical protein